MSRPSVRSIRENLTTPARTLLSCTRSTCLTSYLRAGEAMPPPDYRHQRPVAVRFLPRDKLLAVPAHQFTTSTSFISFQPAIVRWRRWRYTGHSLSHVGRWQRRAGTRRPCSSSQ
jgi:hypothetical protein